MGKTFLPGCFIATVAWGSPETEEVKLLRRFRDVHLARTIIGRKIVRIYYRFGPIAASYIKSRPRLCNLVRFILRPVVAILKKSS